MSFNALFQFLFEAFWNSAENVRHYFMSRIQPFVYTPLPPRSIRVLELQKGDDAETVICTIITQNIEEADYEAISYVWGSAEKSFPIICNGNKMHITPSLGSALTAFRLRDRTRRLWADAICIDQENLKERHAQVRMMGQIYSMAQGVLAWLGHDAGTGQLATGFIHKFNKQPGIYISPWKSNPESNPNREEWNAVRELFKQPYFHRVWIIQELSLAKQAQMRYGQHYIDWGEVSKFVYTLDNHAAFLVDLLQLDTSIANHTFLVWAKLPSGQPRYTFMEVLNWGRLHQSTEPKDRVYAFLGHPSAKYGTGLVVEPEYMISKEEAYTKTAMSIIKQTKSLAVLDTVDHENEPSPAKLPSWVTDWDADARCPLQGWPTPAAPVCHDSISFRDIGGSHTLVVQGFGVDTVSKWSNMLEAGDIRVKTLGTEFQKGTPFLVDHIWSALDLKDDFEPQEYQTLDNLSLALAAGFRAGRSAVDDLTKHRADFFAYLNLFESIRAGETGDVVKSFSSSMKEECKKVAKFGSAHQYIQDIIHGCMGRRIFRTSKGLIGRGPRTMRRGDICCVVLGSSLPLILRKRTEGYLFIGTAILRGWNNGEVMQCWRDGNLSLTEFVIY